MPSLNKLGTVKVPLLVEIELVPVVTVPPLKATAVVAVAAFPVQDPEDPLTFPVTLPVKLALTVAALIVPPDLLNPVLIVGAVIVFPKLMLPLVPILTRLADALPILMIPLVLVPKPNTLGDVICV